MVMNIIINISRLHYLSGHFSLHFVEVLYLEALLLYITIIGFAKEVEKNIKE